VIAATKPDVVVEVDGDNYTFTTITTLKTIKISFTLGQEYEADPGTDRTAKVKYLAFSHCKSSYIMIITAKFYQS